MGIFDWVKTKQDEKKKTKEAEDELRRQAEAEVSEEVIKIKKNKIKEQILAEARGEKKPEGKGMKVLQQLGEEFKQSNIGGDSQMDKLLGKRSNNISATKGTNQTSDRFSTDRLMGSIGGKSKNVDTSQISGKSLNTKQNLAGTLGGSGVSDEKLRRMTGIKDSSETLKKMTRLKKE